MFVRVRSVVTLLAECRPEQQEGRDAKRPQCWQKDQQEEDAELRSCCAEREVGDLVGGNGVEPGQDSFDHAALTFSVVPVR